MIKEKIFFKPPVHTNRTEKKNKPTMKEKKHTKHHLQRRNDEKKNDPTYNKIPPVLVVIILSFLSLLPLPTLPANLKKPSNFFNLFLNSRNQQNASSGGV